MLIRVLHALVVLMCLAWTGGARAQVTLTFEPVKDNTMYQSSGPSYNSNGASASMWAGKNNGGITRRALMKFDLSMIPANSTIQSVSLRVNVERSRTDSDAATLHRVLADWGEGTSDSGASGSGAPATTNDATWAHRFFPSTLWSTAGGDFVATASATQVFTSDLGAYTITGAGMVSDVQAWVANAATNFGWVLRGNESQNQSAMRLYSRSASDPSLRPQLTVTYTTPGTIGACCLPTGACIQTDASTCASQGGNFQQVGMPCLTNLCPVLTAVSATPARDGTLYDTGGGGAAVANGGGPRLIVGGAPGSAAPRRRGVVAFDLTQIPTNAVITSVTLQMYVDGASDAQTRTIRVHEVTGLWGAGTSIAPGDQLNGAPAGTSDATWVYRFFGAALWTNAGGDFDPAASASAGVGTATGGFVSWSSAALVADVQRWVSLPETNAGWALVNADESVPGSYRAFASSEASVPAQRPSLHIVFTIPDPGTTGACCLPSGACITTTSTTCSAQGGTYSGDGSSCGSVICPLTLTPYVDALPLPGVAQPAVGQPGGAAHYEIEVLETAQQLHRDLPPSRVWGYAGSYPGPTIEARRGQPVTVTWKNRLRVLETQQLRDEHFLMVDECLHGPDMNGSVPFTVTHLHGGHVPADSDGYPEDAFPPGGQSNLYTYPNNQQAGTLWYHDHALGITRLNVYMGLAGFYLLRDDVEDALNLPRGVYEIPLVIQDRSFNPDGSLRYNTMWMEHFFGQFAVVNGKVWPYLNVARGKYRFRVLNGSGSRVYRLGLSNGAAFQQIGTDLGLLPAPVTLTQITIAPGERVDLVVDFAPYAPGTEIIMTNSAPAPFPTGVAGNALPNIMKFVVGSGVGDTDAVPTALVPVPAIPESESVLQRNLQLRKSTMSMCPDHMDGMWMINDLMWDDITEFPVLGTTEVWAWVNRSNITHPMHMHLVQFQVLDRQGFATIGGNITPVGPRLPPAASEMGWKDTVQAPPNQITRVIARFTDFAGLFAYHCHILEHEDHEMMRQFNAGCPPRVITQQPQQPLCGGASVNLSVQATGYQLQYQWRRNGTPVVNGVGPGGGVISGAGSAALTITSPGPGDAGSYDVLVTDPCGTTTSVSVTVGAGACNRADLTEVGGTLEAPGCPDGQLTVDDLVVFVNLFIEQPGCPGGVPCNRADITGVGGGAESPDGQLTVDDLIEFVNAFSDGCG